MTISYHSGGRLQATSTDFGTNGAGIPAVTGGWKEIGRTTLGSTTSTIDVASLADKRYLMLLNDIRPSGAVDGMMRLNNDSGSNYACRFSNNGGSDGNDTSASLMYNAETPSDTNPMFAVSYIANLSNNEKLHLSHSIAQKTAGAGTAPNRGEYACKWANTSDAVDRITTLTSTGNNYASGSELVVLGWDESDTHTTNFWEELASDTHTGADTDTFTSSTFTAKKYLWIQCFLKIGTTSGVNGLFRFNGDSGSNYSHRREQNGATDITQTNQTNGVLVDSWSANGLINMFVINNSGNEKLAIAQSVFGETTGAGTAPKRAQSVSKWNNTADQITSFSLVNTWNSDAFASGSIMKVWGSN